MTALLTEAFLTALLTGAIMAGIPLLLAGLGEMISERAGVLNLGIEGMMMVGAFLGFYVNWRTGSGALGFLAGAGGGMAMATVMVLFCVRRGINQIVIGIGLTLFAGGLTAMLHYYAFARSYPRLGARDTLEIPVLSQIPVIGQSLFNTHPVVYLSIALIAATGWVMRRTNLGLAIRAAGDKPAAADTAGVEIMAIRTAAVLFAGTMAGLGGAFLSTVSASVFVPFMTHGDGYIGIVLAMLSRGRPIWVLVGALIFGACLSMTTALQVAGIGIPTDVIQMLPFAAVLLVLILFGRSANPPPALTVFYARGSR